MRASPELPFVFFPGSPFWEERRLLPAYSTRVREYRHRHRHRHGHTPEEWTQSLDPTPAGRASLGGNVTPRMVKVRGKKKTFVDARVALNRPPRSKGDRVCVFVHSIHLPLFRSRYLPLRCTRIWRCFDEETQPQESTGSLSRLRTTSIISPFSFIFYSLSTFWSNIFFMLNPYP